MPFVASTSTALGAAGNITLTPLYNDLSGNCPANGVFSHGLISGNAGTVNVAYDGGAIRVAATSGANVVFAIPASAQVMNLSGACTISLGKVD